VVWLFVEILSGKLRVYALVKQDGNLDACWDLLQKPQILGHLAWGSEELKHDATAIGEELDEIVPPSGHGRDFGHWASLRIEAFQQVRQPSFSHRVKLVLLLRLSYSSGKFFGLRVFSRHPDASTILISESVRP
jgi:hypothetical protein